MLRRILLMWPTFSTDSANKIPKITLESVELCIAKSFPQFRTLIARREEWKDLCDEARELGFMQRKEGLCEDAREERFVRISKGLRREIIRSEEAEKPNRDLCKSFQGRWTRGIGSIKMFHLIISAVYSFSPASILFESSARQSSAVVQAAPVTNPFGTVLAMPQISIGRVESAPSIQYGISSMPAIEKPSPVRISSLLTARHLSQKRIKLPVRKYHPKNDGSKVPLFSEDEDTPTTLKPDALFIPRENPRALVICPMEQWPARASSEKANTLQ